VCHPVEHCAERPSRGIADHPALPTHERPSAVLPQSRRVFSATRQSPRFHPMDRPRLATPESPRLPRIAPPAANRQATRESPWLPRIAPAAANRRATRESPWLPRIAPAAANRQATRESPRLPRIASAPPMDAIPSSQRARKPAAADQINGCPRRLSRFMRAGLPIAFAAKPWHQRKRRTDDGDGSSTRSAASGSAEIRYFVQGRPPEMTALHERRQWCATAEHEQRQAPHPADLATVRPTPRQPARSPGPPTQSE
jgi:hypothetical protein